ncbi:unnamed protein product [Owenia fusiformis]|uniref:Uncharacterized protein n=2 Tax=Owenia fusiformis TaxID=6347 RepID=A0A8J1UHD4_OWEFU|nr:unnamed protein product [Owenia fusiformis]
MSDMSGTVFWVVLGVALFLGSFGAVGGICLALYIVSFIVGGASIIYYYGKSRSETTLMNKPSRVPKTKVGPGKIIDDVTHIQRHYRTDKRMTGASAIDEVLQEILDFTYRDYIHIWYKKISDDGKFRYDMRLTLQKVVIAFSERCKEVDWVPYCTTNLVDDFASHLRLFRRAQEKVRKEAKKDESKVPPDLTSVFFDLEVEMENNLCRDTICTDPFKEREYLQELSDVLLYLLLPPEDFHNKPFKHIVRECLVNGVFLPVINLMSDPDYINQLIIWMCLDTPINNDTFVLAIKLSDSLDELQAVREKLDMDIARWRSKDTGGEDDTFVKQQLSSLVFVKSQCELRIARLQAGLGYDDGTANGGLDVQKLLTPGQKLYSLPFDVILNNNVALSYFIEFMTGLGFQNYLFFYLNVEGFRVSAEQQINAAQLQKLADSSSPGPDLEMISAAAYSIYEQYLSEKASPRVRVEESSLKRTLQAIQKENITEEIFDPIQAQVYHLLQENKFYGAFKKSSSYIKLLAELDLLRDVPSDDESSIPDDETMSSPSSSNHASTEDLSNNCESWSDLIVTAKISQTGIVKEQGRAYAVYAITVTKTHRDGLEDVVDVYRRYSDFHDLHMTIKEKYEALGTLSLPSKKAFNNMNKDFLEKRRIALDNYLQTLQDPGVQANYPGLQELLYPFLQPGPWEKGKSEMARKMDTFVNPLKTSVKTVGNAVKSVPDNLVDGVAKVSGGIKGIPGNMVDGISKVFNIKNNIKAEMLDSGKVGAVLDVEEEDNIPMRIMLLLMDEVFDLKNMNQWLQKRIIAILRQIIKAAFGDMINKKIVDHVEWVTSAEQCAENLKTFRDSFWPCGCLAEPRTERDQNTQRRTRVVCRAKLLASLSDDLRHLIGTETTRRGVIRIFHLFQQRTLNKRLVYVLLEGMLETLFTENKFQEIFLKVHSKSPRVKPHLERRSNTSKGTQNRRKKR